MTSGMGGWCPRSIFARTPCACVYMKRSGGNGFLVVVSEGGEAGFPLFGSR